MQNFHWFQREKKNNKSRESAYTSYGEMKKGKWREEYLFLKINAHVYSKTHICWEACGCVSMVRSCWFISQGWQTDFDVGRPLATPPPQGAPHAGWCCTRTTGLIRCEKSIIILVLIQMANKVAFHSFQTKKLLAFQHSDFSQVASLSTLVLIRAVRVPMIKRKTCVWV